MVVEGEESGVAPVTSGVPQGTVLGPALFLVYINDLPEGLKCTPRLFADDSLLYRVIESYSDCDLVQQDLQTLEKWEQDWSMEFAEDKCKVLRVTRKLKRNQIIKPYEIHNYVLESVNSAKYLGVTLDTKLNFSEHIQDITKKANNTRQFLQRTLSGCDRTTKSHCYKTYVRPILEYGSCAWDPHKGNQKQVTILQSMQNKAAGFVHSDWSRYSSVSSMNEALGWDTLQNRRAIARLVMLHKIQLSLVAIPISLFTISSSSMTTRGAPTKFIRPHCKKLYMNTFVPASISLWNSLPAATASISDPESFRGSLGGMRLSP